MAQPIESLDQQRDEVLRMLTGMDSTTSIAATTVYRIRLENLNAFELAVAELARATARAEGLKTFDHLKHRSIRTDNSDAPLQYLIYERWETVSLYISQWNSDHFRKFQTTTLQLAVGGPALDFYTGPQIARIPRTGQKRCWDITGAPIGCNHTGEDGDIRAGVRWPEPRFVDNGNGTVTDQFTGLIWLRNANAYGEIPWQVALENAKALCNGSYGLTDKSAPGDWRLPNVNEFQSILDLDNSSGPAISPDHPFINLFPSNYWTSSSVALAPALGWFVATGVGPPVFDLKFNSMRAWPVRGQSARIAQTGQDQCFDVFGQPLETCEGSGQDSQFRAGVPFPAPRFIDNQDGTVLDRLTELIWLKEANFVGTKSWWHALEACKSLGDGSDRLSDGSRPGQWRLPNLFELRSLIDYSMHSPALPLNHPFEHVIPSLYWSSTTVASAPNLARFVFVGVGPSVWDHKSVHMHVWPVRGGVIEPR